MVGDPTGGVAIIVVAVIYYDDDDDDAVVSVIFDEVLTLIEQICPPSPGI